MSFEKKALYAWFSTTIKQCRVNASLTRQQAAELFDVSEQMIRYYEQGQSLPKLEVALKMSKHYNMSLYEMCGIQEPRGMAVKKKTGYKISRGCQHDDCAFHCNGDNCMVYVDFHMEKDEYGDRRPFICHAFKTKKDLLLEKLHCMERIKKLPDNTVRENIYNKYYGGKQSFEAVYEQVKNDLLIEMGEDCNER